MTKTRKDTSGNQSHNQSHTNNSIRSSPQPNISPPVLEYESFHHALLVGEGDFSFTAAFCQTFAGVITATELSTGREIFDLYYSEKRTSDTIVDDDDAVDDDASKTDQYDPSKMTMTKKKKKTMTGPDFMTNLMKNYPNVRHILASVDAKKLAGTGTAVSNTKNKQQQQQSKGGDSDSSCLCERWNCETQAWDAPTPLWTTLSLQQHNTASSPPLPSPPPLPVIDLLIYNFPHTDKRGKTSKLVHKLFAQLEQCCRDSRRRMASELVVELRVRDLTQLSRRKIRGRYGHHEAAAHANFVPLPSLPMMNDIPYWESFGYEHRMTNRNATCRGLPCQVWRWQYHHTSNTNNNNSLLHNTTNEEELAAFVENKEQATDEDCGDTQDGAGNCHRDACIGRNHHHPTTTTKQKTKRSNRKWWQRQREKIEPEQEQE